MYISVAWTLMISYQLFTQTAVAAVISCVSIFFPAAGVWLASRIDMIVFIYAFAWVFVLSSAIPSVILGRERSVLVQFFVCLALTFIAFIVLDAIKSYGGGSIDRLLSLVVLFNNSVLATLYLSVPYVLMIVLDVRSRGNKKKKEDLEELTAAYLESVATAEQNLQEE